jgi:mitochondrial fission protein ELM1
MSPSTVPSPALAETAWVVTDGKPGMENQARGLAEAVGLPVVIHRIAPRAPWTWLAPLEIAARLETEGLGPPWPRLLIATGRQSIPYARAIKRRSPATFSVQIQSPGVPARHFDLVVPPRHDRLRGPNVIPTRGALHRVTPARLAAEAATWAPSLAHLPRPLVAVLIGGDNAVFRMTEAVADRLVAGLRAVAAAQGAGFAVTASRRTAPAIAARIRHGLDGLPAVMWDGAGENPYFGYLGLADHVVVTGDSVSMVSEALATGRPVHVLDLEGGSAKFAAFHEGLRADGLARPFAAPLASWTYAPLDDTGIVADEVRRRMGLAGPRHSAAGVVSQTGEPP